MADKKELNFDDMENVAGGAKSNQKIEGQNDNEGQIQNNNVSGNEGDVKITGPMNINTGGGEINLNF